MFLLFFPLCVNLVLEVLIHINVLWLKLRVQNQTTVGQTDYAEVKRFVNL